MHLNYRIQLLKYWKMTNKEALFIKLPILGKDSEFVPKIAEINAAKTNTSRN